jgi:hypothetical protein
VYDHAKKQVVHLSALPEDCDIDTTALLGPEIPDAVASQLCWEGTLNPRTQQPFKSAKSPSASSKAPSKTKSPPRKCTPQKKMVVRKEKNQPVISGMLSAVSNKLPQGLLAMMASSTRTDTEAVVAAHYDGEDDLAAVLHTPSTKTLSSPFPPHTRRGRIEKPKPLSIKSWFANAAAPKPVTDEKVAAETEDGSGVRPPPVGNLSGALLLQNKTPSGTPATQRKQKQAAQTGGPLDTFFIASVDSPEEKKPVGEAKAELAEAATAASEQPSMRVAHGEGEGSSTRRLLDSGVEIDLTLSPPKQKEADSAGQKRLAPRGGTDKTSIKRATSRGTVLFGIKRRRSGPLDMFAVPSTALQR